MKIFRFKISKISHRLTITYAVLFFAALISVNAATLLSVNYYMRQTAAQQLDMIDQSIKHEVNTLEDIQKIDLKNIAQMTDNVDINLIFENNIIYNTGELYNLPFPDNSNINRITLTDVEENKILYLNDKHVLADNKLLSIQIIKDMDYEMRFLQSLTGFILVLGAIILIIAIIVGYIISKKALNPIDKIINQAKQISASDLTKRINIDGPDDELKRLSDTFNDLIERIEYSYKKQNQFALDVSHELATPMAVIKGYIDLIDRWGKNDREILDEGIQSIKNEISNMTKLLDTLFFISKGDNEILKLEKTKFWLNELIVEVVKESKLVSDKYYISLNINDSIFIEADKRLIKQMFRAIIDNSIKYTPNGGKIQVNSRILNNNAVITISDTGLGIPKEDLLYIFDRFYRVDKARTRKFGGSGLGLSIVKWIVEIHGGSVAAESEVGKGTKITVQIPFKN